MKVVNQLKNKQEQTQTITKQKQKLHQQHLDIQNIVSQNVKKVLNLLLNGSQNKYNMAHHVSTFNKTYIVQIFTNLMKEVQHFINQYCRIQEYNKQLNIQIVEKQKFWTQKQQSFSDQIAQLQLDLQTLQKIQSQVQLQNQRILQQNQQLSAQVKAYKTIAIDARSDKNKKWQSKTKIKTQTNQLNFQFNEDDKDFATDLLNYQKQLLTKVYELVTESFKKDDIHICLRKIYEAYGKATQLFRQKLQIEYDLSDLQCQYQKRKATGPKQMLVQLRKQINSFRKELSNQKQILHKQEQILQQKINDLTGQAIHDMRLKNFTIGLQTKHLRRQKTQKNYQNQKQKQKEFQRQPEPNKMQHTLQFSKLNSASVQFRHSLEADEIVKQMIQKDRQNLQKILRQTRNQMRK